MESSSTRRRLAGPVKMVATAVVVLLLTAGSLTVYFTERAAGQTQISLGDQKSPDRVDISVFVQKIDAVTQELSAQVEIDPVGSYADENGFPKQDLTVYTNGTKGDSLPFKAGKNPSTADLKIALNSGIITDYPFDHYEADLGFTVGTADSVVPASVTLVNADAFFTLKLAQAKSEDGALLIVANASRSTGTFFFALFVMLFMWLLSVAALIAAWFAVSGRRGLLFPSMSFMGALLFALVPLRNAVPGQPPIGSVVDFGAFFIAEGIISVSLIVTVVAGYRVERANEAAKRAEAGISQ